MAATIARDRSAFVSFPGFMILCLLKIVGRLKGRRDAGSYRPALDTRLFSLRNERRVPSGAPGGIPWRRSASLDPYFLVGLDRRIGSAGLRRAGGRRVGVRS
jgi:hypothetical protein